MKYDTIDRNYLNEILKELIKCRRMLESLSGMAVSSDEADDGIDGEAFDDVFKMIHTKSYLKL